MEGEQTRTSNENIVAAGTLERQAVDQPRVRMEVEYHRLVSREQRVPIAVGETVGMVRVVDQLEQVDHVDTTNLELGEVLEEKIDGGEGLAGRDVATAGHDDVGLLAGVGAELRPDADTFRAMRNGLFHGEVLEMVLLVCYDDVDVVGRPQAVIHG